MVANQLRWLSSIATKIVPLCPLVGVPWVDACICLSDGSSLETQTYRSARSPPMESTIHQAVETTPMQNTVQHIVMLRHHQARVEAARLLERVRNEFRRAVQDRRRQMHVEEIAREQVAAEQEIVGPG